MENREEVKIPKRVLHTLLSSLTAGVVPRRGAPYIAIGRKEEIGAFLSDLEAVAEGGASVRFLIGRYGSGKSFLIQLVRGYALERDFVTADCDLSPERRLSGGSGGGIATYRELLRNIAVKSSPDGAALPSLLQRPLTTLSASLAEEGVFSDDPRYMTEMRKRLASLLLPLENGVGGFDFSRVLSEYYKACLTGDDELRSAALKWLRGEYKTKTEARKELSIPAINTIIADDNFYDFLKEWAVFCRLVGYRGLVLFIDECVNLYKIPNRISREANYEKLLSIFNDAMQGRAESLFVLFGGTPQFLEDTRRGLFSYEALRSRLADSRVSELGYRTLTTPVIRLRRLSDNELLALLSRLSKLYAEKEGRPEFLSAEEMTRFLSLFLSRVGAEESMTPRELIRNFLSLLSVLYENPDADFDALLSALSGAASPDAAEEKDAAFSALPLTQPPKDAAHAFSLSDIEI